MLFFCVHFYHLSRGSQTKKMSWKWSSLSAFPCLWGNSRSLFSLCCAISSKKFPKNLHCFVKTLILAECCWKKSRKKNLLQKTNDKKRKRKSRKSLKAKNIISMKFEMKETKEEKSFHKGKLELYKISGWNTFQIRSESRFELTLHSNCETPSSHSRLLGY